MFKMVKGYLINIDKINYMYTVGDDFFGEGPALIIVFRHKDELSIVCKDINEAEEIMKQLTGDNNE